MNSGRILKNVLKTRASRALQKPFSTRKTCITTPIFYVNDEPHIGHLYTAIYADAICRWERKCGNEILFTTGTDEHGLKVQSASRKLGISENSLCDRNSQKFVELMRDFKIGHDVFIRTSSDVHKTTVQLAWKRMEEKGLIRKKSYEGWYSIGEESFVPEKSLTRLPDGKMVTSSLGQEVEWIKEENHMFDLSPFKSFIENALKPEAKLIEPAFFQEILLKDLPEIREISISRPSSRISWGIPVPDDPKFSIYVWLDALMNYLTVLGYPASDNSQVDFVHVIGKDIAKFHTIYWIAFLAALGLPAPKKILVHNHWLYEKKKMSKSLGNTIKPKTLLNKYSAEAIRLYFLSEGPADFDTNFDEAELVKSYNDFIEGLSNLIQRVLSPKILPAKAIIETDWCLDESEQQYKQSMQKLAKSAEKHMGSFNFRKAYIEVRKMWMICNKQFNDWKPWSLTSESDGLIKNKRVYLTIEGVRLINELMTPITPEFSDTVRKNLFQGEAGNLEFRERGDPLRDGGKITLSVAQSCLQELFRKKLKS